MALFSVFGAWVRIMDNKSPKAMYISTIIFVFTFAIGVSGL